MDVDAGCRVFHRPANVEVFGAGVARMDAALHADFGGAPRPGLAHAPFDLAERDIVWPTAQRLAHLAFGEGAEATFEITDVGVVDIAGYDVGNDATVGGLSQRVGGRAPRRELFAAATKQPHDVGFRGRVADLCPCQNARDVARNRRTRAARGTLGKRGPRSGRPF